MKDCDISYPRESAERLVHGAGYPLDVLAQLLSQLRPEDPVSVRDATGHSLVFWNNEPTGARPFLAPKDVTP